MAAELISVAQARAAVLAEIEGPLAPEPVALERALGRALAEDAVAPEEVPGFDNSAMDGFAVRASDTAGAAPGSPVSLALAGESRAGAPADAEVGEGQASRISTGAVMPAGADAVLRREEVADTGGAIAFEVAVAPGRDVRHAGDDIRAGQIVLRAGARLGPTELGVLASLALPEPSCVRRPRLAMVSTGDELLGPGDAMVPGGVRNSNAHAIPALAERAGADVMSVERVGDDADATRATLGAALDEADVLVVCGGVSVGDHDHVRPALEALGSKQRFWGVALRPGKPTYFGVRGDCLAFGLPGNPVSAIVTFELFVRPAIEALLGCAGDEAGVAATLTADVPRMAKRDQAVRCSLAVTDAGWAATPTGPQGSHVLTSMLGADALAVVERGEGAVRAGERVRVRLLRA